MTFLLVAHGQPSDPRPAALALERLAEAVAAHLPGRPVRAATLAEPGALARATAGADRGTVYPLFMSCGWFTATHLPARLAEAGAPGWRILPPFGCDPAVQDLAVAIARDSGARALLLAAHGSGRSPMPAAVTRLVAARIRAEAGIPRVVPGFIEQSPRIDEAARELGPDAACLPFFAAEGEHVTADLPQALARAGFAGRILPALGTDPRVPALIARSLSRAGQAAGSRAAAG